MMSEFDGPTFEEKGRKKPDPTAQEPKGLPEAAGAKKRKVGKEPMFELGKN
jgi:hypothetical protein